MVPKMGFSEANQAILKPKAQIMLLKRAQEGFKESEAEAQQAKSEDEEMKDESKDGRTKNENNETSQANANESEAKLTQANYNEHFDQFEK